MVLGPTKNAIAGLAVFGFLPCITGVSVGQYMRQSGAVWLSEAGPVWPLFCFLASVAAAAYVVRSTEVDWIFRLAAWLVLAWSWLYLPFYLAAAPVPASSAVVGGDGRAFVVSDVLRTGLERGGWLYGGKGDSRIIRNVEGNATVHGVDVHYRFAARSIAARSDGEDVSEPVIDAIADELSREMAKPRSIRVELFAAKSAEDQLIARACRRLVPAPFPCPFTATIWPTSTASRSGGAWSTELTEQDGLAEHHVPTLLTLITNHDRQLADTATVFAEILVHARSPADLATLAKTSFAIDDAQFALLIDRIVAAPDAGDEALALFISVSRLSTDQRRALRAKAFQEASVKRLVRQFGAGRITDAELAALAPRLVAAFDADTEMAQIALDAFGERLPAEVEARAVAAVSRGKPGQALAALRSIGFDDPLRGVLVAKVVAESAPADLDGAITNGKLDELLTPSEARDLVDRIVAQSRTSKAWLSFAARALRMRDMTRDERKSIVDGLLFESTKSALEFVSEHRQFLDPADVVDVTRDYARTIAPDFCLHLTHRNANRQVEYFDSAQVAIFSECARKKP